MRRLDAARPLAAIAVLVAGQLAPRLVSTPGIDRLIWTIGLVFLGAPVVAATVLGAFRGRFAADLVASLALVGAVVLDQPLAGLVIVLMQTGGEALEGAAARRASQAVAELEAQAPRIAHRLDAEAVEDIAVDAIRIGDRLLVRPGEMIPCDGVVVGGRSSLDVSRITGEPAPVAAEAGVAVRSGAVNRDGPITMVATALAAASLYHQIVELVRSAQASKAPIQRLADRAAVWFTPATLAACGLAYLASGDPERVLAVLVVATPCPLILAAPVAMLGGINRAARHRIVVRHGTALEQLARVTVAVFDKTGTLTIGQPLVERFDPIPPMDEPTLTRLAGAVEAGSGHLLARTTVETASRTLGRLPVANAVVESPGRGVTGTVEGRRVTVGAITLIDEVEPAAAAQFATRTNGTGLAAYVAVDGVAAGTIRYADRIRPTAVAMTRGLGAIGLHRVVLLTGDRSSNAVAIGSSLGITESLGDLLPADKLDRVVALEAAGERVLMVGDGANDAPALSAASVGMALASQGGGITAEAADVVLLTDDLTLVPEAIAIARRTMRIARQSIAVGLGLSMVAMVFAAAGTITPTVGALLQEAIDVAVILNALRVLSPGPIEVSLHERFAAT